MDEFPKLSMYNICVANVKFHIEGVLLNIDRIVFERDTFDFVGHMADDIIIGLYEDGEYHIKYLFKSYQNSKDGISNCEYKIYQMDFEYDVKSIEESIEESFFYSPQFNCILEFLSFEYKNKELIRECMLRNQDLIKSEM